MTVSEQIIQVLNALCEKFGMDIDWTSANVIPYVTILCEKLVMWEIWTSVAWIAFMAVLTIASIIATKLLYPTFKNGWEENAKSRYEDGWIIGSIFAIVGLVALYSAVLVVTAVQVMDIIKCVTFPEMYVFEYIQGVLNSGG